VTMFWKTTLWSAFAATLFCMGDQPVLAQKPNPTPSQAQPLQVALTFDDLPSHGPLPQGLSRVDIINSIIAALHAAHAPQVYGFLNAKSLQEEPGTGQVLQLWRDAGFPLGNHTYSHMDLDTNSLEAFEKDVLANESTLQKYGAGEDWHWFRFPFLHEGDTAEKHLGIEAFLKEHGYKVAEVTLSFNDYAYNEPYARCLAKHDATAVEQLKQSYLDGAAESLVLGRKISDQLYHRDTKYIMLLHVGGFQTVMLPKLLDLLKQQNFQLITLPEAAADPIYNEEPALAGHWDNLFSQQVLRTRHISLPDQSGNVLAKLNDVCR
jgi:peptidoglycan-N-acetylglucosamine deacetylase